MIRLITKSNFNREKYIASYSIKLFHKIISVTLAQIKTFVLFPFLLLHSVTLTRNYHLHFSDEKPENWTDNEVKKKKKWFAWREESEKGLYFSFRWDPRDQSIPFGRPTSLRCTVKLFAMVFKPRETVECKWKKANVATCIVCQVGARLTIKDNGQGFFRRAWTWYCDWTGRRWTRWRIKSYGAWIW